MSQLSSFARSQLDKYTAKAKDQAGDALGSVFVNAKDLLKGGIDTIKGNAKAALTRTVNDLTDKVTNSKLANTVKAQQVRKYTPAIVLTVLGIVIVAFFFGRRS